MIPGECTGHDKAVTDRRMPASQETVAIDMQAAPEPLEVEHRPPRIQHTGPQRDAPRYGDRVSQLGRASRIRRRRTPHRCDCNLGRNGHRNNRRGEEGQTVCALRLHRHA